jgi:hypothetical protein
MASFLEIANSHGLTEAQKDILCRLLTLITTNVPDSLPVRSGMLPSGQVWVRFGVIRMLFEGTDPVVSQAFFECCKEVGIVETAGGK